LANRLSVVAPRGSDARSPIHVLVVTEAFIANLIVNNGAFRAGRFKIGRYLYQRSL